MLYRIWTAVKKLHRNFLAGPPWMAEPLFAERINRIYRSSLLMTFVWCMGWYERIFSRPARILLIVFIVSSLFSLFSTEGTALFIIMCMLSAALADGITGTLFSPRLEIIRHLPRRGVCGIPFTVSYKIKNKRKFLPALDLLAEPYSMNRDFQRSDGMEYFSISAGTERNISVRLTPLHRGICTLPCAMVESCFPFNIFKHAQRCGGKEQLLVHPAYQEMKFLLMNSTNGQGEQRLRNVQSNGNHSGESLNFSGCREYQNGDSPRRIHWMATARRNKLVVKEFQQEQLSTAAVFLDSHHPMQSAGNFTWKRLYKEAARDITTDINRETEALLSLGASLCYTLVSSGVHISHYSWGSTLHRCSLNGSPADHLPEILDTLSIAQAERKNPLPEMMNAIDRLQREIEEIYLILQRYDDDIHNWIASLRAKRINVRCILLSNEKHSNLPGDVIQLSIKDVISRQEKVS